MFAAMLRYVYQIGPPWWNWFRTPESYWEFDAPVMMPPTKGIGSMRIFLPNANKSEINLTVISWRQSGVAILKRRISPEALRGVDILNPLQPECMDIYEIKAKYGEKLMFWGGISTQQTLPYGTPDEYEMYNLTLDPLESVNLANPYYSNERIVAIRRILNSILQEQCRKKRLSPSSGSVPGMPSC